MGSLIAISSIALHELWYGTCKSMRMEESVWQLRMFLAGGVRVLPFDDEDARISGQIRAVLEKAGKRIGDGSRRLQEECAAVFG